jgi:hypothetical protein
MTRRIGFGWLAAVALAGAPALVLGCSSTCMVHRSAQCRDAPSGAIDSFVVTTITGDDSSDADINFCVRRKSVAGDVCRPLSTTRDDFQRDAIDTFEIPLSLDAGDLHSFFIENTGGAIFGNNEWQIVGLTVEAVAAEGDMVIYDEPGISCANDIDVGMTYQPLACVW